MRSSGVRPEQTLIAPSGVPLALKNRRARAAAVVVSLCLRAAVSGAAVICSLAMAPPLPIDHGLYEPSLARFADGFYLTLRNDRAAYVAFSRDGLHFDAATPWTFDDGTDLGSYHTQARWVTHADGPFLSYTRRGADNDNVIRHRAPLFLAQVDPARRVIVRATERALVPNQRAQLGNFAVVDVSANETWVTTSEGMAPGDPSKYGANGRVYAARLLWQTPNRAWNHH